MRKQKDQLAESNAYYMNIRKNRLKHLSHQSESPERQPNSHFTLKPLHRPNKSTFASLQGPR